MRRRPSCGSEAVDERKGISVSDESLDRADEPRDDDNTVEAHSLDSMDSMDSMDAAALAAKDDEGDDDVHAHSFDSMDAMDSMDSMD